MILLLVLGTWIALGCLTACFAVALIRGGRTEDVVVPPDAEPRPHVVLPAPRTVVDVPIDAAV